jgi:hypothetical protein
MPEGYFAFGLFSCPPDPFGPNKKICFPATNRLTSKPACGILSLYSKRFHSQRFQSPKAILPRGLFSCSPASPSKTNSQDQAQESDGPQSPCRPDSSKATNVSLADAHPSCQTEKNRPAYPPHSDPADFLYSPTTNKAANGFM